MQIKNIIIFDYKKIKNSIVIIFLLTVIYYFNLFVREKIEINIFIFLVSLFFIHYFLFYVYFSSKKETNYIPIYPLVIFYYLVTYSFYFYFDQELAPIEMQNRKIIYPDIYLLIKVLSLGFIFFSLGYFLLNYFVVKKNPYKLEAINKYEFPLIAVFIFFIFFYYFNYVQRLFESSLIHQLKQPIMIFLLAYFQIKYLISKNIFFLLSFIFLFLFLFIIEASFGATVFPFMLVAIGLLINFYKTKKLNIIIILITVTCIFLIHSMKYELRKATWFYETTIGPKFMVKNIILSNVHDTFFIAESWLTKKKSINTSNHLAGQRSRLFHSNISLQKVLAQTPGTISFFNGASYSNLFYKFLPRFMMKNKPKEEWGNFWGKRYGILHPDDTITSWNFTILNEFYANFGIKGVLIGMFLLGLLIKVLLILFSFNFKQPILLSASSTIVLNFFFQEINLSMLVGAVINQISFFVVIIFSMLFLNFLIKKINNYQLKIK